MEKLVKRKNRLNRKMFKQKNWLIGKIGLTEKLVKQKNQLNRKIG